MFCFVDSHAVQVFIPATMLRTTQYGVMQPLRHVVVTSMQPPLERWNKSSTLGVTQVTPGRYPVAALYSRAQQLLSLACLC